jgi:hypothetical protein
MSSPGIAALVVPLVSTESSIEISPGTYNYNIRAYIVNSGKAIFRYFPAHTTEPPRRFEGVWTTDLTI